MKLTISVLIIIARILFAYGVCLLFTTNFNILEWSNTAKVWFLIISLLLIAQD